LGLAGIVTGTTIADGWEHYFADAAEVAVDALGRG
jgi:hypothetical protein